MRLLICTQKVDKSDTVLGFFHRWIEEFAIQCEQVTVICLEKGVYTLPQNVEVYSLGKERNGFLKTLRYIVMFYRYVWGMRGRYDRVFVHMNPEYIMLGGLLWRFSGKRILFWYNHARGGVKAWIASRIAHIVFYVSSAAYMSRFRKAVQLGAGIDTSLSQRDHAAQRREHSILSLGRISPVKHVDLIVDALIELDRKSVDFSASMYGNPTVRDNTYYKMIRERTKTLEKKGKLFFCDGIPHEETPRVFNTHELFVNMTPSGSFDKTILEAAACETLVLTSNQSFRGIFPDDYIVADGDSIEMADKIQRMFSLPQAEKQARGNALRNIVVENHNITTVVKNILAYV